MSSIARQSFQNSRIKFIWIVSVLISVLLVFSSVYAADKSEHKAYGEVKSDMALVYFFWQPDSSFFNRYVFADNQFLGFLQKSSYCFAYVTPGRHLVWFNTDVNHVGMNVEFVPGQTYYIDTGDNISLLNSSEGEGLLKASRYYIAIDAKTIDDGIKRIKNDLPLAQKRETKIKKAPIDDIPIATAPADLTGLVTIPKYTPIKLQLMENISSWSNQTGDTVWFRILEDVSVNNGICFKKGTLVKGIVYFARFGLTEDSGYFNIIIPAVQAVDGSLNPVIGQVISTGRTLSMGTAIGDAINMALFKYSSGSKGKEAFKQSGEEIIVWTRSDSWINPEKTMSVRTNDVPAESSAVNLKATTKPIWFSTDQGLYRDIPVVIETNQVIKDIALVSVNETTLVQPRKPLRMKQIKNTWEVTFKGWDLVRYSNIKKIENTILLRGVFKDGTPFTAEFGFRVDVN